MVKTVEKWVAGIYNDQLYVAKGHFKKTKAQFRREGGSHADKVDHALSFAHIFPRDTDLLHDTSGEALDALHAREMQKIQKLREKIEKIQGHLHLIYDFEIST